MTLLSENTVVTTSGGLVELGYVERTTNADSTVTSLGAASNIFSSNLVFVADGSPVLVEMFCPAGRILDIGQEAYVHLVNSAGTSIAHIGTFAGDLSPDTQSTFHASYRYTPAAGVQTINARMLCSSAGSRVRLNTGSGQTPITLRVSKIIQASQFIVPLASAPLVTSLPSAPIDGQEIRYVADATNGVIWNLRYRAASTSSYKWEFIGGPNYISEGNGGGNGFNIQYTTYSTVGAPSLTIPLAGDYIISYGGIGRTEANTFYSDILMAAFFNGSQLSAPNEIYMVGNGASVIQVQSMTQTQKKTLTVVGGTLDVRHRIAQASRNYQMWNMYLNVQPIRVG